MTFSPIGSQPMVAEPADQVKPAVAASPALTLGKRAGMRHTGVILAAPVTALRLRYAKPRGQESGPDRGVLTVHTDGNDARPDEGDENEVTDNRSLLARWSACVLFAALAAPAVADRCRVGYAEVVNVDRCGTAELPDFRVMFTGITQPVENVPLSCWNYTVTARRSPASLNLSNCHTGELGGEQEFLLDEKPYLFVHGVAEGCRRLANGNRSPAVQGDAFIQGRRDSPALRSFQADQARENARCSQSGKPPDA